MSLLFKKYYSYQVADSSGRESTSSNADRTSTTTNSSTTSSSSSSTDTSTSATTSLSNASLAVKDKSGNVGVINGLTSSDISKLNNALNQIPQISSNTINIANLSATVSSNDAKYVNLADAQTITGQKILKQGMGYTLPVINKDSDNTVAGSEVTWQNLISGHDKNMRDRSALMTVTHTNQANETRLVSAYQTANEYKSHYLSITCYPNGTVSTYTPTPSDTSSDNNIPNTYWVNTKIANMCTTNTAQTITATKYHTAGIDASNQTIACGYIELNGEVPFIDFHYKGDKSDFTSRIAEYSKGNLTCENNLYVNGRLSSKYQDQVPVGSIIFFAGAYVPAGYLLCNGANVSRTTYADLWVAIGGTFGSGDGSTTFTLPNTQNRFLRGSSGPGYYDPQLPELQGNWIMRPYTLEEVSGAANGTMLLTRQSAEISGLAQGNAWTNGVGYGFVNFSANRYNGVYKPGAEVRPWTINLVSCIKY